MTKNRAKQEQYRYIFSLLNRAMESEDVPLCVASIVVVESLIRDRCTSFLIKNGIKIKYDNNGFIQVTKLINLCKANNKKIAVIVTRGDGSILETANLFSDIGEWLKSRNRIVHGFVGGNESKLNTLDNFQLELLKVTRSAFKYACLVRAWSNKKA